MNFVSFFAGIGGFDLGLELAGHKCVGQIEIDPDCTEVLERHWPHVWRHDDITTLNSADIPTAELWVGGFPCQDLSPAGRQRGLDGPSSGLWREFLRCIRGSGPAKVVVENIHSRWRAWVPWVRRDLWEAGYASVPILLRAGDLGYPHERARTFVLAYANGQRPQKGLGQQPEAEGIGQSSCEAVRVGPPGPSGDNGGQLYDAQRDAAPDARVVRDLHGVSAWSHCTRSEAQARKARIKGLGNAVVPACAEVIGRLLTDGVR